MENKFNQYKKTLPLAAEIVSVIFPGGARSHEDFIKRVNLTGDINQVLQAWPAEIILVNDTRFILNKSTGKNTQNEKK